MERWLACPSSHFPHTGSLPEVTAVTKWKICSYREMVPGRRTRYLVTTPPELPRLPYIVHRLKRGNLAKKYMGRLLYEKLLMILRFHGDSWIHWSCFGTRTARESGQSVLNPEHRVSRFLQNDRNTTEFHTAPFRENIKILTTHSQRTLQTTAVFLNPCKTAAR